MLESALGVGVGFGQPVFAVEIVVMGALGQHLGRGQQGHGVVGIIFENRARHLQGFVGIVGLLVESHGLLEEKCAQFAVRKFLGKISGRRLQLGRVGLRRRSFVGIVFGLGLGCRSLLGGRRLAGGRGCVLVFAGAADCGCAIAEGQAEPGSRQQQRSGCECSYLQGRSPFKSTFKIGVSVVIIAG